MRSQGPDVYLFFSLCPVCCCAGGERRYDQTPRDEKPHREDGELQPPEPHVRDQAQEGRRVGRGKRAILPTAMLAVATVPYSHHAHQHSLLFFVFLFSFVRFSWFVVASFAIDRRSMMGIPSELLL